MKKDIALVRPKCYNIGVDKEGNHLPNSQKFPLSIMWGKPNPEPWHFFIRNTTAKYILLFWSSNMCRGSKKCKRFHAKALLM